MFVLDASVALAWCLDDETSQSADRALDMLATGEAVVPAIWPLEVANGLRGAERRGRITVADSARVRQLLLSLPIRIEPADLAAALTEVADLARTFDLSAYDAAYLALAARRGLPMATADDRLAHACAQAGVELVG
jgi:predicted nucleic acid-binding protein